MFYLKNLLRRYNEYEKPKYFYVNDGRDFVHEDNFDAPRCFHRRQVKLKKRPNTV